MGSDASYMYDMSYVVTTFNMTTNHSTSTQHECVPENAQTGTSKLIFTWRD